MRSRKNLAALPALLVVLVALACTGAMAQQSSSSNTNSNTNTAGDEQKQTNTNDGSQSNSRSRSRSEHERRERRDASSASDINAQQPSEKDSQRQLDDAAQPNREDRPGQNIPPTRRASGSRYHVEFGVLPHYNNNYFQASDTEPRTALWITTLSANFGYDFVRADRKTLSGELRLRRNVFSDLRNADSTDVDASLGYDFGANRLEFTYFVTPRRLSSFEDDPVSSLNNTVFNSVNGASLQYARRVTRRVRTRASYEFAREIYTAFKDRDLARHRFSTDVRYRVRPFFTPGIGYEYSQNNARSDIFNRHSNALLLLVGSTIKERLTMSFRYRYSVRDYTTNDITSSNFGRQDRRNDVNFYATVNLPKGFSIYGFASTIDSNSSRVARSFNSTESGIGLFYRFPSR
ncbi:MAG TPA: surface lipoprotein assembly modifier [Pyrinomonadaceae bacterium]|jgi:hypothetical protein